MSWRAGDPGLCAALEAALGKRASALDFEIVAERPGRRSLLVASLPGFGRVFVKHWIARGRSPRQRIAETARLGAPDREGRALCELHAAGVSVPEPLAFGTLPGGDRVLATRWLDGRTLKESLPLPRAERVSLLTAVGERVAQLHAAGYVHRDLHWGNVLVCDDGPHLLDLQAAWRTTSARARQRDVGDLDYSVSPHTTTSDRLRLRAAALGLQPPFDTVARDALRSAGRAARAQADAHARSRTRRSLVPGRAFARLAVGDRIGMRVEDADEARIEKALSECRSESATLLKGDDRSRVTAVGGLVIKEYPVRRPLQLLADSVRGSPARRAWLGGHGLRARGIGAVRPLAFLERRRFGVPTASSVVLEDLRALSPAHDPAAASPERVVRTLARLAIDLHRREIHHGDLKASHVLLAGDDDPGGPTACLIDLDSVRFPRRLDDRARLIALAQLNASLPDGIPDALRCDAFRRYAAAVPFAVGADAALRRVVEISLARRHRWTGAGCSIAARRQGEVSS